MLHEFNLYDLFILCFVQLVVSTVLVLSPARDLGTRFRWTGSRITEVILGALGAAAVSALAVLSQPPSCGDCAADGLETAAYLLVIFSVVVIVLRPDINVVGKVFYASYAAAGFTFLAFAALVAVAATRSIAEALTSSLLDPPRPRRVPRVELEHQLRERRLVPDPPLASAARGRSRPTSRWCRCTSRRTTSRPSC